MQFQDRHRRAVGLHPDCGFFKRFFQAILSVNWVKKKKKNPSVHYVFSTLIAAAARKPEATEQSSSLIGTNIIMGPFFHLSCEIQSIVVEVRSKGHYG